MSAHPLLVWSPDTGTIDSWSCHASDGSSVEVREEETDGRRVLRIDYRLAGDGSWIIARRDLRATLPPHFVGVLTIGSTVPADELQVKLIDPSGANVWWWRRRGVEPTPTSTRVVLRKAGLEFAWGPLGGGYPDDIGAVEIAVAGNHAAGGTLRIEAATIEPRRATLDPTIRAVQASSHRPRHPPANVLTPDDHTTWCPESTDPAPSLTCDLGESSEWGGVVVTFADGCPGLRLRGSEDGARWTPLAEVHAGDDRSVWLRTNEGDGRYLRLELAPGSTPAVARLRVVPLELALSPASYLAGLARKAPRGCYPRHLLGEQAYWAVVSADGDDRKALLGEDGALEVDVETFSIEPFLSIDDAVVTWSDVETSVSLVDGFLPIPSVHWHGDRWRLDITAFASGLPGRSTLVAGYEVTNLGAEPLCARLVLAVRPFQVSPAWQSLNLSSAVAPIFALRRDAGVVRVNGAHEVIPLVAPATFLVADAEHAATTVTGHCAETIENPLGLAEGRLCYDLELAPNERTCIAIAVPRGADSMRPPLAAGLSGRADWAEQQREATVEAWRERLGRVPIELPACASAFEQTLRASIGWILANRVGPRIQPGPRCYRRAWIRDGALTGTALAEMGFAEELGDFLRWYSPFQLADGRVPCAVDSRGADRVPEHDSHGQLIWSSVEHYRLTRDEKFLRESWPAISKAASAIEALRSLRTTEAYRDTRYFGLLPESISHEGYASRPVHSYWDDFFALRGLGDAAYAARTLGEEDEARRLVGLRDAMREDVHASIRRTIAEAGIDFVPGSADLADFDPTSTAIAFDPCDESDRLPVDALFQTYERYWRELEARRRNENAAEAYTAYEVRNASALLMLGRKDRAYELLAWLISDQRLEAWREWPEISWRNRRAPRFLGDLPHGWVASSFVRALRRMVAYERTSDQALVIAAGVPERWVREAPGVRVHDLPTHAGRLDYSMCGDGATGVTVTLGGSVRVPAGGIVVESPYAERIRSVLIDGHRVAANDPRRFVVRKVPALLTLEH